LLYLEAGVGEKKVWPHPRRRYGKAQRCLKTEGRSVPATKGEARRVTRNKSSLLDTGSIISAFSKNAPHQTINRALLRASQKEKEK